MQISPDTMRLLMEMEAPAEQKVALMKAMEADWLAYQQPAAINGVNEERERLRNASTYQERKRAKDRERRATEREELRRLKAERESPSTTPATTGEATATEGDESGDYPAENPLPLPPFPQTPKPPTPTPGSVFTRVREDGDFDLFWTVYPKRIGKADARKAFSKALKAADLQTILCAVERQREWEQWQRGFAPHPATWLNGQRWSDEEPVTPATPPRAPHERPHHDAKFEARQANLSRAFAGADRAAGREWKP